MTLTASWLDYYTTWSFGYLVVATACGLALPRSRCTRDAFDAACLNSLAVGVVGAFVNVIVPPMVEPDADACRRRRAPLNAILHAAPAAFATVVLLRRRVSGHAFAAWLLGLQFVYLMWPSRLGRYMERIQSAYGVAHPMAWAVVLWSFVLVFAKAASR